MVQQKCNIEGCDGHYEFIEIISSMGSELFKCNKCSDEQIPESM